MRTLKTFNSAYGLREREGSLNMRIMFVLTALAFGLSPSEATAQEVSVPETKNPQLRKIANFYDKLEYEAALGLISQTERQSASKPKERLWLELMKGILHHSLDDKAKADVAFLKALEQSPYTSLPVLDPSQTLYERFEALRSEALHLKKGKSQTGLQVASLSLPPASSTQTAAPQPAQAQSPSKSPQTTSEEVLSQEALVERLKEIDAQAHPLTPKLETSLEDVRSLIQLAQTEDARKFATQQLNALEKQLGAAPQGKSSDAPSRAALLKKMLALETKGRRLGGKKLPPKFSVLFEQTQQAIEASKTPEQLEFSTLLLGFLDILLEKERPRDLITNVRQAIPGVHEATPRQQPRVSGISLYVLIERTTQMAEWLQALSISHRDLDTGLALYTQQIVAAPSTAHERMLLAIRLDRLETQIRQRFVLQGDGVTPPGLSRSPALPQFDQPSAAGLAE